MRTVVVRPPRPADAPELAEMWLDHAEYYVALDSDAFQIPERDGLVEWFEELLAREIPSNELSLVAKLDDRVVGFVDARIVEPMTTAADSSFVRSATRGCTSMRSEFIARTGGEASESTCWMQQSSGDARGGP